jgi:hypothetical protein
MCVCNIHNDVNIHNSRLSIPLSQIKPQDFLIKKEIEDLDEQNPMEEVPFIDPSGEVNTMTLTQWDMPKPSGTKSSSYILRTNWNGLALVVLNTEGEGSSSS